MIKRDFVVINKKNNTYILHFRGNLDSVAIGQLKIVLDTHLSDDYQNVIMDLGDVEFLDSTGVSLLASLLKKTHARGGKVIVARADGQPRAVLEMVGFDSLVAYTRDQEEALSMTL